MSALKKARLQMAEHLGRYNRLKKFLLKEVTISIVTLETYLDVIDAIATQDITHEQGVAWCQRFVGNCLSDDLVKGDALETIASESTSEFICKEVMSKNANEIYLKLDSDYTQFLTMNAGVLGALSNKHSMRSYQRNGELLARQYIPKMMNYFGYLYEKNHLYCYVVQHVFCAWLEQRLDLDALAQQHGILYRFIQDDRSVNEYILDKLNLPIDLLIKYEVSDPFSRLVNRFYDEGRVVDRI